MAGIVLGVFAIFMVIGFIIGLIGGVLGIFIELFRETLPFFLNIQSEIFGLEISFTKTTLIILAVVIMLLIPFLCSATQVTGFIFTLTYIFDTWIICYFGAEIVKKSNIFVLILVALIPTIIGAIVGGKMAINDKNLFALLCIDDDIIPTVIGGLLGSAYVFISVDYAVMFLNILWRKGVESYEQILDVYIDNYDTVTDYTQFHEIGVSTNIIALICSVLFFVILIMVHLKKSDKGTPVAKGQA